MRARADTLEVVIRRGYEPGLIGWITGLHGRYYAAAWGTGAAFEILMAREVADFVEAYDPERDLLLAAHAGDATIGAIAVLGQNPGPDGVRLRWFIVDPAHHGRGAGKALLRAALDWCRERGVGKVHLWTVDNLPASRRLYEQAGFTVAERCPDDRYTVPCDNLKMELVLAPP